MRFLLLMPDDFDLLFCRSL